MRKTLLFVFLLVIASQVFAQTKKVLIEEGTGTWCQHCPRGLYYGHQLIQNDSNVILVVIHQNDPMEMSNTDYFASSNLTGLPAGNIDRVGIDVDPNAWSGHVLNQLSISPMADVSVSTSFNAGTRELNMTISAEFYAALNGDYRLGAIVVEDGIIGDNTDYDQSNTYSGGGAGPLGGWENLPNPVPYSMMAFDHVARYLANDYDGESGSLPGSITSGSNHSHTFTWTLPTHVNENMVQVIGYLTDASTGEIINVGKSKYLNGSSNAFPQFVSQPATQGISGVSYDYQIFTHDPDNSNLTVTSVQNLPNWLALSTVGAAPVSLNGIEAKLTGTPPSAGTYAIELEVSDGSASSIQSFTINVSDGTGQDWQYLGTQGFSNNASYELDMDLTSDGNPIVAYGDQQNDMVEVLEWENNQWNVLGTSFPGDAFQVSLAIDNNDKPYVLTDNNGLKVYTFDNGSWNALGGNIGTGVQSDIAVASNGNVYVVYMDITDGSTGKCKMYDGNSWTLVGNGTYHVGGPSVWNRIITSNNNEPYVMFATGSGNSFHSNVVTFNGATWNTIGGGDIDPVNSTSFSHDLKFDANGDLYVALSANPQGSADVYKLNNGSWQSIGANIANAEAENITLAINDNNQPVIGYRDNGNSGKSTVMSYDGSNWSGIGLPGFTAVSSYQNLVINQNGIPFLAYVDEDTGDKVSVKKFETVDGGETSVESFEDISPQIYPNPNDGRFVVIANENQNYRLTDLSGRIVFEGNLKKGANYLDFSENTAGVYFLLSQNQQEKTVAKIVIE